MERINRLRAAFHYPEEIRITTKAMSRFFENDNCDTTFTVPETATKYYIGTENDITQAAHAFDFLPGEWIVYDYYDHYWGMFATHTRYLKKSKVLTHEETTEEGMDYGYVSESSLKILLAEEEPESFREALNWDGNSGVMSFGRGETDYRLYTAYKDEYLGAFLLVDAPFIETFIPDVLRNR